MRSTATLAGSRPLTSLQFFLTPWCIQKIEIAKWRAGGEPGRLLMTPDRCGMDTASSARLNRRGLILPLRLLDCAGRRSVSTCAEEFHLGALSDAGLVGIFDEVLVPRLVAVAATVLLSAFFSTMRLISGNACVSPVTSAMPWTRSSSSY
jgi:hypothetical protein